MGQPTWRKITTVTVPARAATLWTPALDYVTQGKLYRITVETKADQANQTNQVDQTWLPEARTSCTADGDLTVTHKDSLMIDSCAPGALIAKVGGSSADVKPDKDKIVLFAVGRHCVFSVSDATKCGSLYLGMNDAPASLTKIEATSRSPSPRGCDGGAELCRSIVATVATIPIGSWIWRACSASH